MILLKLCLFSVITLSGYQHSANKKIVVVGKASNGKAGAIVDGPNGVPYYLEGIDHWDRRFYGKKVKVSGILVIQQFPRKDDQAPTVQFIGEQRTIKKPKWEVVE